MAPDTAANYHAVLPSEDHQSCVHDATASSGITSHIHPIRHWFSLKALTKWIYFLLGCASLLPYTALANGLPFFLSRLADSSLYTTFGSSMLSVYTVTKMFCLSYCTITLKQSSPSCRIFGSIIANIFLITSLCLSTFVQGTPLAFFSFTLLNAAFAAVLSSYLCSAIFAQAALLGPSYLQAVLAGQSAIMVMASTVQVISAIISLWGLSPHPTRSMIVGKDYNADDMSARIFFGVSTVLLGIPLAAYGWLTRQTFYKSIFGTVKRQDGIEDADELTGLVSGNPSGRKNQSEETSRIYHVLKRNWVFMFSIAYVYAVTQAVYPAITIHVRPVNPDTPPLLFSAIHYLVFCIGDIIGRQTCMSTGSIVWTAKKSLIVSLIRTLFIPLILLCNTYRPGTTNPVTPIINSDILFLVILFVMGLTNGFFLCLSIITVSSIERNPKLEGRREDVDIAATLGSTFMMAGLAFGAFASFGVGALI